MIELANEGTDLVYSPFSYILGANLENLTLTGTANIDGTGNDLANVLTGNAGNNRLEGGAGNDILQGALGADTMIGGSGNDIYYVDNALDVVIEDSVAGSGTDLVYSSMSYTLGDQCREPGPHRDRQPQRVRQRPEQLHDRQRGQQPLEGGLGTTSWTAAPGPTP